MWQNSSLSGALITLSALHIFLRSWCASALWEKIKIFLYIKEEPLKNKTKKILQWWMKMLYPTAAWAANFLEFSRSPLERAKAFFHNFMFLRGCSCSQCDTFWHVEVRTSAATLALTLSYQRWTPYGRDCLIREVWNNPTHRHPLTCIADDLLYQATQHNAQPMFSTLILKTKVHFISVVDDQKVKCTCMLEAASFFSSGWKNN